MAAMGSRSLSSPSPFPEDTLRISATSPEPHYRLSRLNPPPPPSANLRPPSMISRSLSAGMTFSFIKNPKEKERERELQRERERERNNNKDMQGMRAPSPDERASSSRFGKLRKKVSMANLISGGGSPHPDDLSLSSRSTSSSASVLASPVDEGHPGAPDDDEGISDTEEGTSAPRRFVKKNAWRTRYKTKLHPYPDVPYPQAYDPVVLQNERATHHLLRRLSPNGSPTFYNNTSPPPASVLDLGCGAGLWLLDAARIWRATQFIGFDLVDVAVPALTDGSVPNVRLLRGDFLQYALPFPDNQFELVRMANLQLAIPQAQWERVLREVRRVLVPGGRLEIIYDDAFFPYGDVPAEELFAGCANRTSIPAEQPAVTPLLSPSTPRPPPPTPETSAFFDSSDDDDDAISQDTAFTVDSPPETSDDEVLLPTPDNASEHSSFAETASTLVDSDASERGSREYKTLEMLQDGHGGAPKVQFEPVHHRLFSGLDHLVVAIPPTPEPLATVDVTVASEGEEGEMPLTPVPLRAESSASTFVAPATRATGGVPQTPMLSDFRINPAASGSWTTRAAAAQDLERVYSRMLAKHLGINPRAGDLARPTLVEVFGERCVERGMSMHLKLAPVGCEERKEGRTRGEGKRRSARSSTGSAKEKEKRERALDTPVPQGLSAKAAERLGIVGTGATPPPTVRRRPTLFESPDESEEDEAEDEELYSSDSDSEEHNNKPVSAPPPVSFVRPSIGRGLSTWTAPSEWDAPPGDLEEDRSSLAPSTTQMTITQASSSRTITSAGSTRTVTRLSLMGPSSQPTALTHTRGGSAASTASAMSMASSASSGAWSATGVDPPRVAYGLAQHPGLLLWPATLLALSPMELEMHATKHMQTLLGCKAALAEYIGTFIDPQSGKRVLSDEEFEDALWEYECFRRSRFNWPDLPEGRLDAEGEEPWDFDAPTPVSARGAYHAVPPRVPGLPEPSEDDPHPFGRYDLPHVRTFRIFSAVKEGL